MKKYKTKFLMGVSKFLTLEFDELESQVLSIDNLKEIIKRELSRKARKGTL